MSVSKLIGQNYLLPNEIIIFSFTTNNGKFVYLCRDKTNKYLVYRFGTKDNVELEFPKLKDKTSWQKFEYSGWLRGGGIENEGIDLDYLAFINEQTKYVLFSTYIANGEKYEIGIRIIDLKTNKTVIIRGQKKTKKGTLVDFRTNKRIKEGDEGYD